MITSSLSVNLVSHYGQIIKFLLRILICNNFIKTNTDSDIPQEFLGCLDIKLFKQYFIMMLDCFFNKSNITFVYISSIISQFPELGWALVPNITEFLIDSKIIKKKLLSLSWLLGLLKMKKTFGESGERFTSCLDCFYKVFLAMFPHATYSSNIRTLLILLRLSIKQSIHYLGVETTQSLFPLAELLEVIDNINSKEVSILALCSSVKNLLTTGTELRISSKSTENNNQPPLKKSKNW